MKQFKISTVGKEMMAAFKLGDYTQEVAEPNGSTRRETMDEAVARVMSMHRAKYASKMTEQLEYLMDFAAEMYMSRRVLGSQRAFQFGGTDSSLLVHEAKMYNCSVSFADRPRFFAETLYLLLCGCGVGFSVQKQHVAKMPAIAARSKDVVKTFVIPDSIEGWADAVGVLMTSYFDVAATEHAEYQRVTPHFDYSLIRPKGAMIRGGFKAPGPDGLRASLDKIEELIERRLAAGETRLRTIDVYDIVMHTADAVLSGGVRRSATIAMFSMGDEEMMKAKTGDWFIHNPQRGRSNNSVMVEKDTITREEWAAIMKSVKDFGEPGFIFTDNTDFAYNPLTVHKEQQAA